MTCAFSCLPLHAICPPGCFFPDRDGVKTCCLLTPKNFWRARVADRVIKHQVIHHSSDVSGQELYVAHVIPVLHPYQRATKSDLACVCTTLDQYVRAMIPSHLLLMSGVEVASKESIPIMVYEAVTAALTVAWAPALRGFHPLARCPCHGSVVLCSSVSGWRSLPLDTPVTSLEIMELFSKVVLKRFHHPVLQLCTTQPQGCFPSANLPRRQRC